MAVAAHRWVSNSHIKNAYKGCGEATYWLAHPHYIPHFSANFFDRMLRAAIHNSPQNEALQKALISNLQIISPKSGADFSANDTVIKHMKFSRKITPFLITKTLYSYNSDSIYVCDRSTCDELLRRHFKHINWMEDTKPPSGEHHTPEPLWKNVVPTIPEPYLLAMIRNYKEMVKDRSSFVFQLARRDFSFAVWDSACNAGLDVDYLRHEINVWRNSTVPQSNLQKIIDFCDYRCALEQRRVLRSTIEEQGASAEPVVEITPPRKRKM